MSLRIQVRTTSCFPTESDYAANIEKAECVCLGRSPSARRGHEKVKTPTQKTIEALVKDFDLAIEKQSKTLIVHASDLL